jgi:predicted nucleic acid-binding protein
LARLIVLDASVVIAALAVDDVNHHAARRALADAVGDLLVVSATTRTEVLVGPAKAGGERFRRARAFLDACETVPVGAELADRAAILKARHPGVSVPDAITLVVADVLGADRIWTFDRRWAPIDARVVVPASFR